MLAIADSAEVAGLEWCKEALEALHAHYPGHMWMARHDGGVLFIQNARLMDKGPAGASFGFAIHADEVTDAKRRKQRVIFAGGELLERAGWRRGAWSPEMDVGLMDGSK